MIEGCFTCKFVVGDMALSSAIAAARRSLTDDHRGRQSVADGKEAAEYSCAAATKAQTVQRGVKQDASDGHRSGRDSPRRGELEQRDDELVDGILSLALSTPSNCPLQSRSALEAPSPTTQSFPANSHIEMNDDVWGLIFHWLDVRSLLRASRACRRWYLCTNHQNTLLWRSLFVRLFPTTLPASLRYPQQFFGMTYKDAVLYKHLSKERFYTWGSDKIVVTPYQLGGKERPPLGDSPYRHSHVLDLTKDSIAWVADVEQGYVCFAFLSRLRNAGGITSVENGDYIELDVTQRITGLSIGDSFIVISCVDHFRIFRKGGLCAEFEIPFLDSDEHDNPADDDSSDSAGGQCRPFAWSLVKDVLTVVWSASPNDPRKPSAKVSMWDLGALIVPPETMMIGVSVGSLNSGGAKSSPSQTSIYRATQPSFIYFEAEAIPDLFHVSVTRDSRWRLCQVHILCTSLPSTTGQKKPVSVVHTLTSKLELVPKFRRTASQQSKISWASVHHGGQLVLFIGTSSYIESRWLKEASPDGSELSESTLGVRDDYPLWNLAPVNIELGRIFDVHVARFTASVLTDCVKGQDPEPPVNLLFLRRSSPRLRVVDLLTGDTLTSFRFSANLSTPANLGIVSLTDEGVFWVADNGEVRFRARTRQMALAMTPGSSSSLTLSSSSHLQSSQSSSSLTSSSSISSPSAAIGSTSRLSTSVISLPTGQMPAPSSLHLESFTFPENHSVSHVILSPSSLFVRKLYERTVSKPAPPTLHFSSNAIRVGGGGGLGNSGKARTKKKWKLRMTYRKHQSSKTGMRPVIGIAGWDDCEVLDARGLYSPSDDEQLHGRYEDEEDYNQDEYGTLYIGDSPNDDESDAFEEDIDMGDVLADLPPSVREQYATLAAQMRPIFAAELGLDEGDANPSPLDESTSDAVWDAVLEGGGDPDRVACLLLSRIQSDKAAFDSLCEMFPDIESVVVRSVWGAVGRSAHKAAPILSEIAESSC
ncbi:hypothetical protein DFJ73DRAFT_815437 [Zopfochytrium polystomum]|nr:hypothetical protein DFJ73DRAFT_815437 [Zopfochytrium polystomum]